MRTLTASLLVLLAAGAEPAGSYRLLKTVAVPGSGGWDYLTVDEAARRVYVSHGTQVDVLDADSGEHRGTLPDTKGVHGIALAPDLGRGFTSNGRSDSVTVFDLKTLKAVGEVKTGKNPDAILYEPASRRVLAFNGGSASATVIDAEGVKAVHTLALGGRPEFAVADGTGQVFVNLEDKSELLKLDARKPAVLERWPLAPGKAPTGLAIDRRNHRLFVGCANRLLAVVNAETGKVLTTLPIGERVDATAFDPETGLVFSSNGDGTVTVVRQEGADKYAVEGTLKTRVGSKTMVLDPKTHRLFIPAAAFKPAAAATPGNPRPRPQMVAGSFVVLIYGR
jgi:DNA-binding beta-propeller fold protein YncE